MKFKTFLIILVLYITTGLSQSKSYYQIESQTNSGLSITFDFKEVFLDDVDPESPSLKSFNIPGLSFNYEKGKPVLPVLAFPLTLPEGKVTVTYSIEESQSFDGLFPAIFNDYNSNTEISKLSAPRAFTQKYPVQFYEMKDMGLFRDYKMVSLRVYPLQVTPSGVLFFRKFKIKIKFQNIVQSSAPVNYNETELLKRVVANKYQVHLASPKRNTSQPPPPTTNSAEYGSRLRIIVGDDGIYQITGNDLINAGIDISQIIPSSFRMTNKGRDVAIFLLGDEDEIFDPEDYLEFWGEMNRETLIDTYTDVYADPFSDENVYWLEWGGAPGLRVVEENGSLVTTNPTEYNPSPFFRENLHFEENQHFERLGIANQDQLSYTRDLWFFDSGIKSVGKKIYPFTLIYPDSSSFHTVTVNIMLSGKSFGSHDVLAWLNNTMVGKSDPSWFRQDTSRITNRTGSTIRNTNLAHGQNSLELQMPTPVQSGIDFILLNWFDVKYDREFKAFQNRIEFRRPSITYFPNINLYQFDIDGFTNPDIEIYKKGISKIVNFDIQFEMIGNRRIYQVSFQDNILSEDIEYIALTSNQKKKPLRIEIDQPYDEEKPIVSLKDFSNSADYIIITHPRFYESAKQLLDYRRSQGLDVEMVKVQDIYDEFNHGIKSPLAVQRFLKYAYRNWNQNHKLKYVLFFGDANFDYKSQSPVFIDFVPTFFYQSEEFGAVATDYPYSLISGNDLIPDLFIGRLPVTTNSDVLIVVSKIIEYEQNAPVGAWRNQALYISGNDLRTYEFNNSKRPLFRTQNSRVLENQLPANHSSFRLNTIRDTSKTPDPNFGSTTDLIEYFDDGIFHINFMGHGGGAIWADVKLMNLNDVDRLNNKGMYPFITSMTCFTGAYDNPGNVGLAQKFVLSPDKGAIGVVASSGLGWAYNDFAILWAIGQYTYEKSLSIGEITSLGKIHYVINKSSYYVNDTLYVSPGYGILFDDMVHQYNLIGDPYIKLAKTPDNLNVELDSGLPQAGDTLNVTVRAPFAPAEGYVEVADNENTITNRIPIFTSDFTSTFSISIPQNFSDGTGLLRAYLTDNMQDGSGTAPIGVNASIIDSVVTEPAIPDADDSVYVRLRAEDASGIKRIYLLRQNNFSDTLFAEQIDPGIYRTLTPFRPTNSVEKVYFSVYVENLQGQKSVFRYLHYQIIEERPDVFVYRHSLSFTGKEKTQLQIALGNDGGSSAENMQVNFYDGYLNFKNNYSFASSSVSAQPGDSALVKIDFPLPVSRSQFMIYVKADPQNEIQDFNRSNNIDSSIVIPSIFNVTPELGSTYQGTQNDTISFNSIYKIYFPPNSVNRPTAVRVSIKDFKSPEDQPALTPLHLLSSSTYHGVEVSILNRDAQNLSPYKLELDIRNATENLENFKYENIRLYEKQSESQPWLYVESIKDSIKKIMKTDITRGSFFAPFLNSDNTAPRIELTVNGRPIQKRAQISAKPVMYVVIEDESGLNLNKDQIQINLDGKPAAEEKVFVPDSTQRKNILGITIYPEFTSGEHQLSLEMKDVNGNVTSREWDLVVDDEFDVHVYGNFPNPFSDETIFSYFVSPDVLDEFEIRIYTVSGKLIKRITDDGNTINDPRGFGARNVGYNELIWDGTDSGGFSVANGVYFALIRAKYQDQVQEQILKVAKLR
jgi:hypothetical protein